MCKLFRLIVLGHLNETVLKACAKYAASTLALRSHGSYESNRQYYRKIFTHPMRVPSKASNLHCRRQFLTLIVGEDGASPHCTD